VFLLTRLKDADRASRLLKKAPPVTDGARADDRRTIAKD
jgi:hypothetical protein